MIASLQASALEELRRLVAFMNHSVAAAAAVTPTAIPTSMGYDGTLSRSPAAWSDHVSPGKTHCPADCGDSTQVIHSAGTPSYDEADEGLSLNT